MATIKKATKSKKTAKQEAPVVPFAGILQPLLKHRFIVSPIIGMDNCPDISFQTVRIKYDLATKQGWMVVEVPLVGNGIVAKLNSMMTACKSIIIEARSGQDIVASSVGLCGLNFTKCEIAHDYALSGVVAADIEFTFQKIITTTGIDGTERIIGTEFTIF